jgi:hypothetical protein
MSDHRQNHDYSANADDEDYYARSTGAMGSQLCQGYAFSMRIPQIISGSELSGICVPSSRLSQHSRSDMDGVACL